MRISVAVVLGMFLGAFSAANEGSSAPPPRAVAESPASIVIETGRGEAGRFVLAGRGAAQQLLVTAKSAGGAADDMTDDVAYSANPAGVVDISSSGWVTPVSEGEATIRAVADGGREATCRVQVTNLVNDLPVSFPQQVTPVFTKYGCNAGGCHGKSGGQNGFALSLLGFEPKEDYEHLLHESRGRRVFPAAPERSLLLRKAVGSVPHGGGRRFEVGSPPYRVIHRWIQQGMPYGSDDDPVLVGIEVAPQRRTMDREGRQQLVVIARYSDGSTRDVTRTAQYESNEPDLAEVSETGLVTSQQSAGTAAVMVRYQASVAVFRATIPSGHEVRDLPGPKNFIDELVFRRLSELGLPPSAICGDSTFVRRATLDIAGRLPTVSETEAFLTDDSPDKRERLVERLISSGDYADYFANKWAAILRNKRSDQESRLTTYAFHDWLRQSLHENRPYDQFAREILAAAGRVEDNPAVAWYHAVRDPTAQVEDMAQLFLGMRIQCAKCHHHPYEKWSQQDYYGLSAFFSRVGRKPSTWGRGRDHIYHNVGAASARNPKTGANVPPTPLGDQPLEVAPEEDPRQRLADWLSQPENPFFARALVNRYWKHFFGRGLVDPEDDMRLTNPASNPALLNGLAEHFVRSGYDLQGLVRTICTSQVYSLSAEPNEFNKNDKQNFSRFYPKRLNAEVLLDAIDTVTASKSRFAGVPVSTRAVQLPDNAFNSYFLTVFGRPDSDSACECERSSDVNLAQCLHLLNSGEVQGKLKDGRSGTLASEQRPHDERLQELYMTALCRPPTGDELATLQQYLEEHQADVKAAYEDIVWTLINTKEFLFNH
jgi:hypothetical protein